MAEMPYLAAAVQVPRDPTRAPLVCTFITVKSCTGRGGFSMGYNVTLVVAREAL
jgi:hypothetical protein